MKHLRKINENSDNKEITFVRGDDWEGIYCNGKLLTEGHSINIATVLTKLGYNIKPGLYLEEDQWDEIGNICPKNLEDVKIMLDRNKYNI